MKEYANLHIYIESGYIWGEGMPEDKHDAFFAEITDKLTAIGYSCTRWHDGHCPTARKNGNGLYIHPMDISGCVVRDDIPELLKALEGCKTFEILYWKDWGNVYEMTDDEYMETLGSRKNDMIADMKAMLKTKKRNMVITNYWRVTDTLIKKYGVIRNKCGSVDYPSGSTGDFCNEYITKLLAELVRSGIIVEAQTTHGTGYRTATEKEISETAKGA